MTAELTLEMLREAKKKAVAASIPRGDLDRLYMSETGVMVADETAPEGSDFEKISAAVLKRLPSAEILTFDNGAQIGVAAYIAEGRRVAVRHKLDGTPPEKIAERLYARLLALHNLHRYPTT